MKKVAFIAPTYPVLSETFIQTEVDAIKGCGHDVSVLTFKIEEHQHKFDYEVINIGNKVQMAMFKEINVLGIFYAIKFIFEQKNQPKLSLFNFGLKLALQLAQIKAEHIHAHFCQHTAAHAIVAAKLLNITSSFVAHGHDVYESSFDIDKKILASDFVVTVCKDMKKDFEKIAKGNIKLLHCGVKLDQFTMNQKKPSDHLNLVFIGRLTEQKGIHILIDALAPIAKTLSISLDIVGVGELDSQLREQVVCQGLSNNIRFLGAKPHNWVKDNLSKYECLVVPFCFSQTGCVDTGPLILKEAMAVGTLVITSNIMGCKEIVTAETGYLVNEKSVTELKNSIELFAKLSFEKKSKMANAARARVVQYFDAQKQAKQLSSWIQSLM
tara:strand:- start:146 stop:1291 length:1146 start_codon:yes stop_codon:yes gene_type:complete